MRDNAGDKIRVYAEDGDVVTETEEGGRKVTHVYTGAKARKLAKQLRKAADVVDPAPAADKSMGFTDGDVVLITDIGAVLRYDGEDDAWYSAGPEAHDCSLDVAMSHPNTIRLLASPGRVSW